MGESHRIFDNKSAKYIVLIISLIMHSFALLFAETIDADAVTRTNVANSLIANPKLIYSGVWPCLSVYFNAFFIIITQSKVFGPKIFTVLCAVLTVLPMYSFTKRVFNKEGALWAVLIYQLCPLVFLNSLQALTAIPFIFFIMLSFDAISKILYTNHSQVSESIKAGLYLTIASGFRYVGWMLIALLGFILLINKKFIPLVWFGVFAMIFPMYWMIGNYIDHQDIFYGMNWSNWWTLVASGTNNHVDDILLNKRIFYFGINTITQMGPLIACLLFGSVLYAIYTGRLSKKHFQWLIIPMCFLCFYTYNTICGKQFMQPRFSILPIVLFLPFISIFFEKMINIRSKNVVFSFGVFTMLMCGFIMRSEFFSNPIPRLEDRYVKSFVEDIDKVSNEDSGYIFDFIGWDNSFYMNLNCNTNSNNSTILNGVSELDLDVSGIVMVLNNCSEGIIVLKDNSKLFNEVSFLENGRVEISGVDKRLHLSLIDSHDGVVLYTYKVI